MNIFALKGHKVKCHLIETGHKYQIELAEQYLLKGETYMIDHTDVGRSFTDVYLQEIPGLCFNSTCFVDIFPQPVEDTYKHPDYIKYIKNPVQKTEKVTQGHILKKLLKKLKSKTQ